MAVVADRVRETTTTTGTGALTLAGATSGCRTFNSALGVGVACFYTLLDANGTGWECGIGQLSSSTSFTRTTVQKSSNSDAAISLSSGTHLIFCSLTAGWAKFNVDSSGNVGLGDTPPAWSGVGPALHVGPNGAFIQGDALVFRAGVNAYYNGTSWVRRAVGEASVYLQTSGAHVFYSNPSGAAGSTFTPTERARVSSSGAWLVSSPEASGYNTGAGGAVTQGISKVSGVTLDKPCGTITMSNSALGNATAAKFTLTNSKIAATDVVNVSVQSGTSSVYLVSVVATAAGSCDIAVYNASGGSLSEAIVLNFAVIKAVAA